MQNCIHIYRLNHCEIQLYLPVWWARGNRSGWRPAAQHHHTRPSAGHPTAGSAAASDPRGDLSGNAPATEAQDKFSKSRHTSHKTPLPPLNNHFSRHERTVCVVWLYVPRDTSRARSLAGKCVYCVTQFNFNSSSRSRFLIVLAGLRRKVGESKRWTNVNNYCQKKSHKS